MREPINKTEYTAWLLQTENQNDNYCTELCREHFIKRKCNREKCNFAHRVEDLHDIVRHSNYKTQTCEKYKMYHKCKYNRQCHYIHDMSYMSLVNKEFTAEEFINVFIHS